MTNDDGSAALEFITVGVILLVPLAYLVIVLGVIQQQTLGVEAAARHTVRVIAQAPDAGTALERSETVLAGIVDEYGLDEQSVDLTLKCVPVGIECPAAGATAVITVSTRVLLPFMPPIFELDRAMTIELQAEAAQKVSRTGGGS